MSSTVATHRLIGIYEEAYRSMLSWKVIGKNGPELDETRRPRRGHPDE